MSKLPILMYHNVCKTETECNKLTVSKKNLDKQFEYLNTNNYKTFYFSELENMTNVPKKSIVLTFDDVTENQFEFVLPLLEKYNLKASFFIPFKYIGEKDCWNTGTVLQKIMSVAQLKESHSRGVELGYHSYNHKKYSTLNKAEIDADFLKSEEIIENNSLILYPVLAYPFGNYPRGKNETKVFKEILYKNKIKLGLKIGNRPNSFPFKDNYEVKRIEISGKDNFFVFRLKIRIGKLKLF